MGLFVHVEEHSAPLLAGLDVIDPPTTLASLIGVHGVLDSARSFTRLSRRLRPGRLLVAYDRRGYQRSREVGDHIPNLDDHVEDLLAIVEEYTAPRAPDSPPASIRPIVLGHSYGGIVALTALDRHPGFASAVIVYEPPLSWLNWWQDDAAGDPERELAPRPGERGDAFAERFARTMLGAARYGRLSPEIRAGFAQDGDAALAEIRELAGGAPFDASHLTGPITLVRGGETAPRHVRGAAWLFDAIPGAQLRVIRGASHGGHLTNPGELAAIVEEVASTLEATESHA